MFELYEADRAIVKQMLKSDEVAFEAFFDTYFPKLYRFAVARLDHDAQLAEEVVQATLSSAVGRLSTYRGEAALFTWLCAFCRREISAHYGRQRRSVSAAPLIEDSPDVRAALESLGVASGDGPDERLRRQELSGSYR